MSLANFSISVFDFSDRKHYVCVCACTRVHARMHTHMRLCALAVGLGPVLAAEDKDVLEAEPLTIVVHRSIFTGSKLEVEPQANSGL